MPNVQSEQSDSELINELRSGKETALRIIYDRYGGLVYTIAIRILSKADEAEDLTQEIFLTFWKQEKFDPSRACLKTYLSVMTRSRALNKIRGKSTMSRAVARLQQLSLSESPPIPLEQVTLEESQKAVIDAMRQLSDKQRQVLEMNYYFGFSHTQISQKLEMPLGTVKSNARQGLIKLRQLLGDGDIIGTGEES